MTKPARIFLFALILLVPLYLPLFPLTPFISPSATFATSPASIVINEIMWTGSSSSWADEWVELWNMTSEKIDISGWQLTRYSKIDDIYQENLMLEIPPEATVSAKGYFLISNYDHDNTKSKLNAVPDLVNTKVALANERLQIKLYDGVWDSGGNLIDTADDGVGKPVAGDKEATASMARKESPGDGTVSSSWYTSTASAGFDDGAPEKGTPGSENTDAPGEDPPEEEKTTYSDQIFLNEIMPNPEGSDTENEYLEFYNAGDKEISLEGWKIGVGEGAPKIIGDDIKLSSYLISASGFLVIYRKDSHSVLNNKGGAVRLLNPVDGLVDDITYPEVDEDWVYQRYPDGDSGWSESNQPSARAANKTSSNSSTSSGLGITFSVDDGDLKVNQSFDVQVEIKNAKGLHDYYVKIRLGLKESKLSKGRTQSSRDEVWLADNSAWKNFPVVYTDSDGGEKITVSAKVASGNPAETYIIGVRVRDTETGKNFDSETQVLDFGEEDPPEADSEEKESSGEVLGTTTELPATGGGLLDFVVTNLFVTAVGIFGRVLSERRSLCE